MYKLHCKGQRGAVQRVYEVLYLSALKIAYLCDFYCAFVSFLIPVSNIRSCLSLNKRELIVTRYSLYSSHAFLNIKHLLQTKSTTGVHQCAISCSHQLTAGLWYERELTGNLSSSGQVQGFKWDTRGGNCRNQNKIKKRHLDVRIVLNI